VKLEFLADGSADCPHIRLFEFTPTEAARLQSAVAGLATRIAERVEVHQIEGVESIGNCRLALVVRDWNQGVVRTDLGANFECGFTVATWDNVAGLIEPFAQGSSGYQWLADSPGEAPLLFSVDGRW
jgi:hypothetical protein